MYVYLFSEGDCTATGCILQGVMRYFREIAGSRLAEEVVSKGSVNYERNATACKERAWCDRTGLMRTLLKS